MYIKRTDSKNKTQGGTSLFTLLLVLFIGLKLGKVITWPWLWVMVPLWGPICLALGIVLLTLIFRK